MINLVPFFLEVFMGYDSCRIKNKQADQFFLKPSSTKSTLQHILVNRKVFLRIILSKSCPLLLQHFHYTNYT